MCEDEYVRAWVSERVCKRQRVCEGKCDGVECVCKTVCVKMSMGESVCVCVKDRVCVKMSMGEPVCVWCWKEL